MHNISLNMLAKYGFGWTLLMLMAFLVLDPVLASMGLLANMSHLPTVLLFLLFFAMFLTGSLNILTSEAIAFYFGVVFILFFSLLHPEGFRLAFQLIANLVLAVIIYKVALRYDLRRFSLFFSLALAISFLIIIQQGHYAGGRMVAAEDANPSHLAALAAGSLLFACAAFTMKGRSLAELVVSVGLIVLTVTVLFLTQGRSAILSLFLAFGFTALVYVFYFKQYKWLLWIVFLLPISIFATMYFADILLFIDRTVETLGIEGARTHRLALLIDASAGDPTAGRLDIWTRVLSEFEGIGLYGLGAAYEVMGVPPHNIYISILVEMTIFGLLVYIGLLAALYWSVLKRRQYVLSTIVMFLILLGLGNDVLYYKYWWFSVFVLCFWIGYHDRLHTQQRAEHTTASTMAN